MPRIWANLRLEREEHPGDPQTVTFVYRNPEKTCNKYIRIPEVAFKGDANKNTHLLVLKHSQDFSTVFIFLFEFKY